MEDMKQKSSDLHQQILREEDEKRQIEDELGRLTMRLEEVESKSFEIQICQLTLINRRQHCLITGQPGAIEDTGRDRECQVKGNFTYFLTNQILDHGSFA